MNLPEIFESFNDQASCYEFLIEKRWPNGAECPKCNSHNVCRRKESHRFLCRNCNRSFSGTSGTILHSTKLPILKWLMAISVILCAKKGVSSLELSRILGVNRNTAWYMQKRLRKAMREDLSFVALERLNEKQQIALSERVRLSKRKHENLLDDIDHQKGQELSLDQLPEGTPLQVVLYGDRKISTPPIVNGTTWLDHGGDQKDEREFLDCFIDTQGILKKIKWGGARFFGMSNWPSIFMRAMIGQFHQINPMNIALYLSEINFKRIYSIEDQFELLWTRLLHRKRFAIF